MCHTLISIWLAGLWASGVCSTLTQSRRIKDGKIKTLAKESQRLMRPSTSHPMDGGEALGQVSGLRTGLVPPFAWSMKDAQREEAWTQALDGFTEGQRTLVTSSSSGLKFHFRSQYLKSFFFLIYVSCGKSEEKPVEHLLSVHLEGRKYVPSLLGKHSKHWCFHNSDTSWFSKPPAWQPRGARRRGEGGSTWAEEVCFGSRAWNL